MSEILRPGCSRPSQNAKQYGGETAGYLDKATLESRQLAVAKLQLERFAGGEGVGQLKVFRPSKINIHNVFFNSGRVLPPPHSGNARNKTFFS